MAKLCRIHGENSLDCQQGCPHVIAISNIDGSDPLAEVPIDLEDRERAFDRREVARLIAEDDAEDAGELAPLPDEPRVTIQRVRPSDARHVAIVVEVPLAMAPVLHGFLRVFRVG